MHLRCCSWWYQVGGQIGVNAHTLGWGDGAAICMNSGLRGRWDRNRSCTLRFWSTRRAVHGRPKTSKLLLNAQVGLFRRSCAAGIAWEHECDMRAHQVSGGGKMAPAQASVHDLSPARHASLVTVGCEARAVQAQGWPTISVATGWGRPDG
jgi:hypothetical protein